MPINYSIDKMGKFRAWLFFKGTRVVEMFNALSLIAFAVIFAVGFDQLVERPTFEQFANAPKFAWFLCTFIVGIIQFFAAISKSLRSNQFSGIVLLGSAVIWAIVALTFYASPPPTPPEVAFNSIMAIACCLAGIDLLRVNKRLEDEKNKIELNDDGV